jgi:hypothetical protein
MVGMLVFAAASGLPATMLHMKAEASAGTALLSASQAVLSRDVVLELVAAQAAVLLRVEAAADRVRLGAPAAAPENTQLLAC